MQQERGTIVHARPHGFAFVRPDAGGPDAFASSDVIKRSGISQLRTGQKVAFDIVPDRLGGRGPRAVKIRVIGDA